MAGKGAARAGDESMIDIHAHGIRTRKRGVEEFNYEG
jgi:hypothetical protein